MNANENLIMECLNELPRKFVDNETGDILGNNSHLTRNGLEVMKEKGLLTIRSYIEGDKVVLSIADEGCGIPPENLDKLGTPFFTTKDDGTGLGLATCYKIAESHNAKINIDSSPRGTTFFIIFPIPKKSREK
ncbi:ATP-binding protein [Desulfosporosinus sp. BG]|uniref:ATP-binding protein n=1 Tax=Desulfosporosinus sp. BG TaxID=1633135 RepID=UPI000839DABA|nr:Sporulation kinase [Desulfosporosinus sp. BG]